MRVMNGATVSQAFFSSHVGIGSRGHCLAGNLRISDVTASTVTGRNLEGGQRLGDAPTADGELWVGGG